MIVEAKPAWNQALSFIKSTGYTEVEYSNKNQIT